LAVNLPVILPLLPLNLLKLALLPLILDVIEVAITLPEILAEEPLNLLKLALLPLKLPVKDPVKLPLTCLE
jgi:hypothetical protein